MSDTEDRVCVDYIPVVMHDDDDDDDDEFEEEQEEEKSCCLKCCLFRIFCCTSQNSTRRSNTKNSNRRNNAQSSHHRDGTDREPVVQAPKPSGSLMRWSVSGGIGNTNTNAGASGSGAGTGYRIRRKSGSAPGMAARVPTGRQRSAGREAPLDEESAGNNNNDNNNDNDGNRPNNGADQVVVHRLQKPRRADRVPLASVSEDVVMIPIECLDTFLPAGVPKPFSLHFPAGLKVVEVDEARAGFLAHLMMRFKTVDPVLETPLANPWLAQKTCAIEFMNEVARSKIAIEGLVLSNYEPHDNIPFISLFLLNPSQQDPQISLQNFQQMIYEKYDPVKTRYSATHTADLFYEVASLTRVPFPPGTRRPLSENTGYIISVYKVFEGDDGVRFERNWLYWTGARMLYRYLPRSAEMRRITLHKSASEGDKMYILICECSNFRNNMSSVAVIIPALRGRLCGWTGVYRPLASF